MDNIETFADIYQAIATSARENRIVRVAYTEEAETEILCVADDSADLPGEIQFWGYGWRVALRTDI